MDPISQLNRDREAAHANSDPCAYLCTVATVDAAGEPQARTMVLRKVEQRLALFGNATSPKWQQIAGQGLVCIVVWLPSLGVQYRLRCEAEPVPKQVVDNSWLLRPRMPKQLDWYYNTTASQSSALDDRAALLTDLPTFNEAEHQTAPPTAQGWFLTPAHVDRLDLNHSSGVHERYSFTLADGAWQAVPLVP